MRLLILTLACMALTGCQGVPQSLENMSEDELFAHNLERPLMEKIYCTREAVTSTYIKKRRCMSVAEWVDNNVDSYMQLDVLNSPPSVTPRGLD